MTRAQQCARQGCNNRTNDPSGSCYLHASPTPSITAPVVPPIRSYDEAASRSALPLSEYRIRPLDAAELEDVREVGEALQGYDGDEDGDVGYLLHDSGFSVPEASEDRDDSARMINDAVATESARCSDVEDWYMVPERLVRDGLRRRTSEPV